MEDLSLFYKTLRDVYRNEKMKKKRKLLEELINIEQIKCAICKKKDERLCGDCIKYIHKDAPDLTNSLFCDLFKEYQSIFKIRRIALYEFLFKQVGSVYHNDSNLLNIPNINNHKEFNDIKILTRRLNEFNLKLNSLIIHSFDLKDEKIMFSNFKMKINREIIKNYFLIDLLNKAEVIKEHLYKIKYQNFDIKIIEREVLNVYKQIYGEI